MVSLFRTLAYNLKRSEQLVGKSSAYQQTLLSALNIIMPLPAQFRPFWNVILYSWWNSFLYTRQITPHRSNVRAGEAEKEEANSKQVRCTCFVRNYYTGEFAELQKVLRSFIWKYFGFLVSAFFPSGCWFVHIHFFSLSWFWCSRFYYTFIGIVWWRSGRSFTVWNQLSWWKVEWRLHTHTHILFNSSNIATVEFIFRYK